ncbi:ribbon-helix-helix domain-containing protein [Albidovulum sediminis]|uniref:Ribbon-helix-helix domain-containing protein n=1 Tax=Albidovulum sediminis TaxID=3066345 RepID=A0ABT2NH77_9RHOB|nr:ribbon-helix-helix domain-containing protein [Defluviimonas sediminis]MCT8328271.1 ribbon-helix-helix domain-containing protein [Defluviimonas sediminis]
MTEQEKTITEKRRGRPATGLGTLIGVRLQPDLLAWVDAERAKLDPAPSRPEFIRQLIEAAKG